MSRKIFVLLILFFLSFSFVMAEEEDSEPEHCMRQDIQRSVGYSIDTSQAICPNSTATTFSGCGGYDYIFAPTASYGITDISNYTYICEDGAVGNFTNFVVMGDSLEGRLLGTNSTSGGPTGDAHSYCQVGGSGGSICYMSGGTPVPSFGDCSAGNLNPGGGNSNNIYYTFTGDDVGEHQIYTKFATISPSGASIGSMSYNMLTSHNIFVGNPSLLVFGQEQRHLSGTFDDSGKYTEEVFFTLMNKSFLEDYIVDYEIVCVGDNVTCTVDESYLPQNNGGERWTISPGDAMFIRGNVEVDGDKIPDSFTVALEVEYATYGIPDCPGTNNGVETNCEISSEPAIFQIGLKDQQDFQVELKGSEDQDFCAGPDGIFGVTGEEFAPKVNIGLGSGDGTSEPLVQIDECDEFSIIDSDGDGVYETTMVDGQPNEDYVYCSQKEFLISLGAKIGRIAEIKEKIRDLNAFDWAQEDLDELREEEAGLSNFNAYLREQDFSKESVLASISGVNATAIQISGVGSKYGQNESERLDKYELLLEDLVQFNPDGIKKQGKWSVSIELRDNVSAGTISEGLMGSSDILFQDSQTVNQGIEIIVSFGEHTPPEQDWFFYENGEQEITDDAINIIISADSKITNLGSKRSIILEQQNDTNNLYLTYAVPLLARIVSDSNGDADVSFTLGTGDAAAELKDATSFTSWSGLASTLGEGCSSIKIQGGADPLPYRMLDNKVGVGEGFEISDYANAAPNQEMILETVLYLPMNTTTLSGAQGSTIDSENLEILWSDPDNLYTINGNCSDSATGCSINHLITEYKFPNTDEPKVLESVFQGIADEDVCVYNDISASGSRWLMFWNQQKIAEELDDIAQTIIDANPEMEKCTSTVRVI